MSKIHHRPRLRWTTISRVLALGLLLELIGCGRGGGSQSQPVPDFSLAVRPTSQAVGAGSSASVSLSATALNGFSSQVGVQVTGAPAGVSVSPTSITLVPGTPQQVTFSAAANAANATATVTFTGTSGSLTHTAGLSLSVNGSSSGSCSGVSTITTGAVTWSPQWCQEFNGAAAPPDTTVWGFDLGNNNGWGNNEVEVYCGPPGYPNNPSQCPTAFSTSTNTVYIDGNGHLVIQPINNNGTWLSTRMKTEGIENFQYGLIEASLQIPDTTDQGLWPAFWSLGSDYPGTPWPNCGEADFMENWSPQVDGGPGPAGNRSTIHTAETGGPGIGGAYTFPSGEQADTAFHNYGVIWSANMMEFFVDNPSSPFFIVTPSDLPSGDTWPFNADIFLIMNVAVGGTLGGSTGGLTNPQPMMADYVRWYTSSSGAAKAKPALGNPAPITVSAGITASSKLTPELTSGTGFVYFSCSVDAPEASCKITTTDRLNTHVVDSGAKESVTVTVATSKSGTPAGSYAVTVYAFVESNPGNGENSNADASIAIPLTVKN